MSGPARGRFLRGLLGLILLAAGLPGSLHADEIGSSFIAGLIRAQLVFEGEVVAVRYRLSTPTAAEPAAIPHTFVTYRIDHIYKGSVDGGARSEVTLRFVGGQGANDAYLLASGLPLFDVGDHDVLLAAGNGEAICPLTRCVHGRYRLIDGYAYNEDGQEIVATPAAPVVYGRFHALREVMTHRLGAAQLQRVAVHEDDESGLPSPQAEYGVHYDAAGFRAIVAETLTTLAQAGLLPPQPPLPGSDPAVAFSVASPAAVTPGPEPFARLRRALQENPGGIGRLEALLVRFNGGDPRLPDWAANLIRRVQQQTWMQRAAGPHHDERSRGEHR